MLVMLISTFHSLAQSRKQDVFREVCLLKCKSQDINCVVSGFSESGGESLQCLERVIKNSDLGREKSHWLSSELTWQLKMSKQPPYEKRGLNEGTKWSHEETSTSGNCWCFNIAYISELFIEKHPETAMFKGVFRWNAQNRASLWHPAFFPNTSKHYFKLEKLLLLYYLLDGFVPALRNLKRWSPDALWEKQKTLKEKKTDKHIDKTWYGCCGKAVLTSKTTL